MSRPDLDPPFRDARPLVEAADVADWSRPLSGVPGLLEEELRQGRAIPARLLEDALALREPRFLEAVLKNDRVCGEPAMLDRIAELALAGDVTPLVRPLMDRRLLSRAGVAERLADTGHPDVADRAHTQGAFGWSFRLRRRVLAAAGPGEAARQARAMLGRQDRLSAADQLYALLVLHECGEPLSDVAADRLDPEVAGVLSAVLDADDAGALRAAAERAMGSEGLVAELYTPPQRDLPGHGISLALREPLDWAALTAAARRKAFPKDASAAVTAHPGCPAELRDLLYARHPVAVAEHAARLDLGLVAAACARRSRPKAVRTLIRRGLGRGLDGAALAAEAAPAVAVLEAMRVRPEGDAAAGREWERFAAALAGLVREHLGDDVRAWRSARALLGDFAGNIPELLAQAAATAPDEPNPPAPRPTPTPDEANPPDLRTIPTPDEANPPDLRTIPTPDEANPPDLRPTPHEAGPPDTRPTPHEAGPPDTRPTPHEAGPPDARSALAPDAPGGDPLPPWWPEAAGLPAASAPSSLSGARAAFVTLLDAAPDTAHGALAPHLDARTTHDLYRFCAWRPAWPDQAARAAATVLAPARILAGRPGLAAEAIERLLDVEDPETLVTLFWHAAVTGDQRARVWRAVPAASLVTARDRMPEVPEHLHDWRLRDLYACADPLLFRLVLKRVFVLGLVPQLELFLHVWRTWGPGEVSVTLDRTPVTYSTYARSRERMRELLARPDRAGALAELEALVAEGGSVQEQVSMWRSRGDRAAMVKESHRWHWAELLAEHRREPFHSDLVGLLPRVPDCPEEFRRAARTVLLGWECRQYRRLMAGVPAAEVLAGCDAGDLDSTGRRWLPHAVRRSRLTWAAALEHGRPAEQVLRFVAADEQARAALAALMADTLKGSPDAWLLAVSMLPGFTGTTAELLRTAGVAAGGAFVGGDR